MGIYIFKINIYIYTYTKILQYGPEFQSDGQKKLSFVMNLKKSS